MTQPAAPPPLPITTAFDFPGWRVVEVKGACFGHARALGGNAIIGMRFDSSSMGESMTEVVAYGTAVVVEGA